MSVTIHALFYNHSGSSESRLWTAEDGQIFSRYAPVRLYTLITADSLLIGQCPGAFWWLNILIVTLEKNLYQQKLCLQIGIFFRMCL